MSETATLTLTDFLLARITEDEAVARDAGHPQREWVVIEDHGGDYSKPLEYRIETKPYPHEFTARSEPFGERVAVLDGAGSLNLEGAWASRHIVRHDPAHVLAECEAKRRIVKAYQLAPIDALLAVLLLMAEVYADHPDYRWRLTYREEWRA